MKTRLTLVAALLLLAQAAFADGEARLLRFPATDGTSVVFSYAGQLYTAPLAGGTARRLTVVGVGERYRHVLDALQAAGLADLA